MADTFFAELAPSYGVQKTMRPRVRSVAFNDGYELRVGDGLNTMPEKWTLSWNAIPIQAAETVDRFLKNQGGVKWFWWTPPRQTTPIKVVCKEWTRGPVDGSRTHDAINASFTQVFDMQG